MKDTIEDLKFDVWFDKKRNCFSTNLPMKLYEIIKTEISLEDLEEKSEDIKNNG